MPVSEKLLPRGRYKEAPFRQVVLNETLNLSRTMTKSMIETISEAIRDPKHPFRKTDSHPRKAMKNRYERRKIKEYLHLADWDAEQAM